MMDKGFRDRNGFDAVQRPAHYCEGREIEPIDVIEDWELGYPLGNVVKYVSRAGRKGDTLTDLRKAAWYLERAIRMEEAKEKASAESAQEEATE